MKFRPCIDLHGGLVKQIVGSTLNDQNPGTVTTNFIAEKSPQWFAELYRKDRLSGGHIIKLGPGNDQAARQALSAWPEGMQLGGGITADNAKFWLAAGASRVIVTSYIFHDGLVDMASLKRLVRAVGREHLVLDLSCRKKDQHYYIVTDRWQKFTRERISAKLLEELAAYCDEFLIHAADVEGRCSGVEEQLIEQLGKWTPIPTTYAGGISSAADLELIRKKGAGRLDFTVGSGLDIFGGSNLLYTEMRRFS
jgi:phosphoribosylformimino-5-aminoimidazole carboxamide ribotide isomerase